MVAPRHRATRRRRAAPVVGGVVILVLVGIGLGVVHVLTSPVATTTTTTTTTTLAPTTTTTLAPLVTMSAVGDTDLGNTPQLPANPAGLFAPVRSLLTGDIVFGNLEGTMTTGGPSKCAHSGVGCYAFRVPPSYARVYRDAGFTVLNSANNHS